MNLRSFRGRILCVDNNVLFLQALAAGLELHQLEVVTAAQGMEALAKFHAYDGNFFAVLTDNQMPEMNGVELVRQLRAEGFKGRIIVMSAHLTPMELRAYHDLQVNGFFTKTFELDSLTSVL